MAKSQEFDLFIQDAERYNGISLDSPDSDVKSLMQALGTLDYRSIRKGNLFVDNVDPPISKLNDLFDSVADESLYYDPFDDTIKKSSREQLKDLSKDFLDYRAHSKVVFRDKFSVSMSDDRDRYFLINYLIPFYLPTVVDTLNAEWLISPLVRSALPVSSFVDLDTPRKVNCVMSHPTLGPLMVIMYRTFGRVVSSMFGAHPRHSSAGAESSLAEKISNVMASMIQGVIDDRSAARSKSITKDTIMNLSAVFNTSSLDDAEKRWAGVNVIHPLMELSKEMVITLKKLDLKSLVRDSMKKNDPLYHRFKEWLTKGRDRLRLMLDRYTLGNHSDRNYRTVYSLYHLHTHLLFSTISFSRFAKVLLALSLVTQSLPSLSQFLLDLSEYTKTKNVDLTMSSVLLALSNWKSLIEYSYRDIYFIWNALLDVQSYLLLTVPSIHLNGIKGLYTIYSEGEGGKSVTISDKDMMSYLKSIQDDYAEIRRESINVIMSTASHTAEQKDPVRPESGRWDEKTHSLLFASGRNSKNKLINPVEFQDRYWSVWRHKRSLQSKRAQEISKKDSPNGPRERESKRVESKRVNVGRVRKSERVSKR